jgi:hypothetical protein
MKAPDKSGVLMQAKELAEARERMEWHELMSRRNIESSEVLQVRTLSLTSSHVFCQ